jgi:hypothetical protein
MQTFLSALFVLAFATGQAQDCLQHSLLKPGTELEYRSYMPKMTMGGKAKNDHFEITRLVFTVESQGTIVKKGSAASGNTKDSYKKEISLKCDGQNLLLPYDFYAADTVYLSDIYPGNKNAGFYSALIPPKNTPLWSIPLVLEGKKEIGIDNRNIAQTTVLRDYMPEVSTQRQGAGDFRSAAPDGKRNVEMSSSPVKNEFEITLTIKDIKINGKKQVTTPAGSFDCYQVTITAETVVMGRSNQGSIIMYIADGIGLIKTETQQGKAVKGYTELVRIKK